MIARSVLPLTERRATSAAWGRFGAEGGARLVLLKGLVLETLAPAPGRTFATLAVQLTDNSLHSVHTLARGPAQVGALPTMTVYP